MAKFEVGKEYKTRDGERAVIYAYHEGQDYPYHGATLDDDDGEWVVMCWAEGGLYFESGDQHPHDLMPEAKEWDVWVGHEGYIMTFKDMSEYGWTKIRVREVLE